MTRPVIRTAARCLLLPVLIPFLTGCSGLLVGSWKADPVPKDVDYYIKTAKFKDDGTFTASAQKGKDQIPLGGSYEFDGFKLVLKRPSHKDRIYKATYLLNNTLKLDVEGKSYTLKKQ